MCAPTGMYPYVPGRSDYVNGDVCLSICGPGECDRVSVFVGRVQGRQQRTILIVLSHKETVTLNCVSTAAAETQMPVRPQL